MSQRKEDEIKVRVPASIKNAIRSLADNRLTSESEIAREAMIEYLRARDISLHETNSPGSVSEAARAVVSAAGADVQAGGGSSALRYPAHKRARRAPRRPTPGQTVSKHTTSQPDKE